MLERLQKILARAGYGSRRKCEELIRQGRVSVNGFIITQLGTKADPEKDLICVDGKPIKLQRLVYIMLNKPKGYICTNWDPHGRPKVVDLVRGVGERVYYVGRLDTDTEGLLILTNDGDLTQRLTHPRFKVERVYHALVRGVPREEELKRFEEGVVLEDGTKTQPAQAKILEDQGEQALLELVIREGKKHQVKRMFSAIGYEILYLKRVAMGPLKLDPALKPGQWRYLTEEEVKTLAQSVELDR